MFSQLTHADQCDHMPPDYPSTKSLSNWPHMVHRPPGLDIKHMVYMPVWHVVLNIYLPCTNFHMPSQYLYKPCKAYVHCWKNKCMPILKNHLPSRACNHKSLCALGQDLHAPGMRARLNVEPWPRLITGFLKSCTEYRYKPQVVILEWFAKYL